MLEKNKIYCGDNLELIKQLDDNYIDLTVTSPPYDNLRTYNGYSWDFEGLAKELFRVTKDGGVVVWVVGDATINGSETGTSFRQAIYFMECGFNLHDTMIYYRQSPYPANIRYNQCFEYMFVFCKNKIKTHNLLNAPKRDVGKKASSIVSKTYRQTDGSIKNIDDEGKKRLIAANKTKEKTRDNIWYIPTGYMVSSSDKIAYQHPATYPEKLAEDHIISWSNKGDLILDPFLGSGTTAKMALKNERDFIGFEISQEYCDIAEKRIAQWREQKRLF